MQSGFKCDQPCVALYNVFGVSTQTHNNFALVMCTREQRERVSVLPDRSYKQPSGGKHGTKQSDLNVLFKSTGNIAQSQHSELHFLGTLPMNEPPTALQEESCYTHCITGLWSRHTGRTVATVASYQSSIVKTPVFFSTKQMSCDDNALVVYVDWFHLELWVYEHNFWHVNEKTILNMFTLNRAAG